MTLFQQFLAQAAAYTRKHVREESTLWRWATVTSVDPVLIRYDGTPGPAIIPPTVLGPPVGVGDRVRTATVRGHTDIWGTATDPDPGLPYAMAAGHVSVSASGGIGIAEVSFPPGRFTVSPMITVSAHSTSENITNVQFTDPSKDGFTAVLLRSNDVATGVHWQAVQMTADSAEG